MTAASQTVTPDTIAALPEKLRNALGMAAIDQDGWANRAALKQLEKRGLVISYPDVLPGKIDGSVLDQLPLQVTRYEVPLPVHIAYCMWASGWTAGKRC